MRCAPTPRCRRRISARCWPSTRRRRFIHEPPGRSQGAQHGGCQLSRTMLQLADLHAFYGKSHILHGVDMQVGEGEIVSLLGRNGSGRSTTVKTIMGLVRGEGSIRLRNDEILGHRTFDIAHRGIGYVPENRDIFPKLTVHQNLQLGEKRAKKSPRWSYDDMYRMFPRLKE